MTADAVGAPAGDALGGGDPTGQVPGRAASLAGYYVSVARIAILTQLQYRVANLLSMIGWLAEPVIYLVVWTTVAESQGGSVAGLTTGNIAAYYIVWTLVRNMNVTFTPYGWEQRIVRGDLSAALLRPIHPIHFDLAYFAGWKFVFFVFWFPIAAFLTFVFRPALDPTVLQVAVFIPAIWLAFVIRTLFLWLLGMVTFWTTRMSAICEAYMALELFLSGRLVPLAIMPGWVQVISQVTPFSSTFGFPIEALAGPITTGELLAGFALQVLWTAVGAGLVRLMWRRSVRRYTAVGN